MDLLAASGSLPSNAITGVSRRQTIPPGAVLSRITGAGAVKAEGGLEPAGAAGTRGAQMGGDWIAAAAAAFWRKRQRHYLSMQAGGTDKAVPNEKHPAASAADLAPSAAPAGAAEAWEGERGGADGGGPRAPKQGTLDQEPDRGPSAVKRASALARWWATYRALVRVCLWGLPVFPHLCPIYKTSILNQ